jgi:hypothetical protein
VHVPPPVEVILMVLAVTEPLAAAGPNALTQSPTARSVAAAAWVAVADVELVVVTLSVWVLGFGGVLGLLFDLLLDLLGRAKVPGAREMPDTVMVEPLTDVTLPEATARDANCLRKLLEPLDPPGKLGRVPLAPPAAPPAPPVRNC